MFHLAVIIIICLAESITEHARNRFYKTMEDARCLANQSHMIELESSFQDLFTSPYECIGRCNEHLTCRAANLLRNGTCELVMSEYYSIENNPDSTLYIGEYGCAPGFGYLLTKGQPSVDGIMRQSCYKVLMKEANWQVSRDNCMSTGGDLVSIETEEEQNHIIRFLESNDTLQKQDIYWTSGSDADHEGTWTWMATGSALAQDSYSSWEQGQPNNYKGVQHCLVLERSEKLTWNDLGCEWKGSRYGLCEAPAHYFKG